MFSSVQLCSLRATLWAVAHQAPVSMGFSQARRVEWVAISFSRESSWPRSWTHISCVSCIASRFFITERLGKSISFDKLCFYFILPLFSLLPKFLSCFIRLILSASLLDDIYNILFYSSKTRSSHLVLNFNPGILLKDISSTIFNFLSCFIILSPSFSSLPFSGAVTYFLVTVVV